MNRITLLASQCLGSNIVCDVGCDHGYVLIEAIKNYGVSHGIASDVAMGPLASARKNIIANKLSDKIDVVLSDGLKNVFADFDTIIIAGMGGSLIVDILASSFEKIKGKKLILQPNNDRCKVRSFLNNNGFIISDEFSIIDSNKYYEILVFNEGNRKYNEYELKYGPILLKKKEEAFISHYKKIEDNIKSYIEKMTNCKMKNEKLLELKEVKGVLYE